MEKILGLIMKNPAITMRQMADEIGISRKGIESLLPEADGEAWKEVPESADLNYQAMRITAIAAEEKERDGLLN